MRDAVTEPMRISVDDEVVFRLPEGRRPIAYPDTVTRVSYELGIDVIHTGTVWAVGYMGNALGLELDDGTVVLADDIDPESLVMKQAES